MNYYDPKQKPLWDTYRAFHKNVGPFVMFETGEIILRHAGGHSVRGDYPDVGVTLASTDNLNIPLYLEDGTEVKSAWLNDEGPQDILIHHKTGRVVRAEWTRGTQHAKTDHLPDRLKNAYVHIASDTAVPVASAKIDVSVPDTATAKAAKPWVAELRKACTAYLRLRGETRVFSQRASDIKVSGWFKQGLTVEAALANMLDDIHALSSVANCGVTFPRIVTQHAYLYTKEGVKK